LGQRYNSINEVLVRLLVIAAYCYANTSHAEDFAVISSAQNTNTSISKQNAINIFMGRFRQFPNGEKATPIDNKSVADAFYKALVNKSPAQLKAYWARLTFSGRTLPPKKLTTTEQVINAVALEKQAISYIPANKVTTNVNVLFILKENK